MRTRFGVKKDAIDQFYDVLSKGIVNRTTVVGQTQTRLIHLGGIATKLLLPSRLSPIYSIDQIPLICSTAASLFALNMPVNGRRAAKVVSYLNSSCRLLEVGHSS